MKLPNTSTNIYKIIGFLCVNGASDRATIFTNVPCGIRQSDRTGMIRRAIAMEQVIEAPSGLISLTHEMYIAASKVFLKGQSRIMLNANMALPRTPREFRQLSTKNIPRIVGDRADIPDWSLREAGFSLKTIA